MDWILKILGGTIKYFSPKPREVDQKYTVTSGVQEYYESKGYKVAWAKEDKVQGMLKQDRWEYAYEKGALWQRYILKVKNSPHDLVLLVKKV